MKKFLFMLVALTISMVATATTPKSWDTDIGSYVNVTVPTNVINVFVMQENGIETIGHLIKPGFSQMYITYKFNDNFNTAIYKRVRHRQGNMIRAVQPVRNSFMTTA